MATNNRIKPGWYPGKFFLLNAVAIALLITWIVPLTRALWDQLDLVVFRILNGTLQLGHAWSGIWAVGNSRYIDIVVGLLLTAVILRKNIVFKKIEVRRALFTTISLILLLVIAHMFLILFIKGFDLQRSSPSRVVPDSIRLGEIYPWMKKHARMKDSSPRSFPGDHASVLILWALFVSVFARGARKILPISLALLFSLPRVIAGAHWFSDVLVGSISLALFAFAWGYCTPIGLWVTISAEKIGYPLIYRIRKIPVLGKLSVLQ